MHKPKAPVKASIAAVKSRCGRDGYRRQSKARSSPVITGSIIGSSMTANAANRRPGRCIGSSAIKLAVRTDDSGAGPPSIRTRRCAIA